MAFSDLANRMASSHGKGLRGDAPSMLEFEQTGWQNRRRHAIHQIFVGASLLVLGLVFAVGTFLFAMNAIRNGSAWIAITPYGAIVFGAATLARGWRNLKQLPPRPEGLAAARISAP